LERNTTKSSERGWGFYKKKKRVKKSCDNSYSLNLILGGELEEFCFFFFVSVRFGCLLNRGRSDYKCIIEDLAHNRFFHCFEHKENISRIDGAR